MVDLSVLISAYRDRGYLTRAVASALDQTLPREHYEVIVDMGYSDPKAEQWLSDNDVSVSHHDYASCGRTHRELVNASRGRILCILDDDDMFTRTKLEVVYKAFQEDRSLAFLHNNFVIMDEKDRVRQNHPMRRKSRRARVIVGEVLLGGVHPLSPLMSLPYLAPNFNNSCVSVSREVASKQFHRLDRIAHSLDTFYFFASLISRGNVRIIPSELTLYRVHSLNLQHNPDVDHSFLDSYTEILNMVRGAHDVRIEEAAVATLEGFRLYSLLRNEGASRASILAAYRAFKPHIDLFRKVVVDNHSKTSIQVSVYLFLISPSVSRRLMHYLG